MFKNIAYFVWSQNAFFVEILRKYASVYSIVKDSSADLGVNFKIVQIRPTVQAVCTKISKNVFCIFLNILIFLRENKEASFFSILNI